MAAPAKRRAENVAGPWFVDSTCIDCDACRQCAPGIFEDAGGMSAVVRQPATEAELREAARALLACPTGSIGVQGPKPPLEGLFPQELEDGVFYAGFNAESSFGANSFFVRRPEGNLMVDSPRFTPKLESAFDGMGGIAEILLTHQDDVADAAKWARRFGARVWIHEDDRRAAPFASALIRGRERATIRPGLVAIPVPGHTAGSVLFHLEDRYLFTGDSLAYSRRRGELTAFRDACWYSWAEQKTSLASILDLRFEWVLAGHGDRRKAGPEWMRASLGRLVERM